MAADVIIVGGGVMGCAVAWFLGRERRYDGRIVLVEQDLTFARASSSLSASGIRQQFTTPVSIAMSAFGWEFLSAAARQLDRDVGLRETGYLLLGEHAARGDAVTLTTRELERRFPWLNSTGIESATLGTAREGWFDGPALHAALLAGARAAGTDVAQARAVGYERTGSTIESLVLDDGRRLRAEHFVHACGAWSASLLRPLDIELPVAPRKRDVFAFACPEPPTSVPMVWDVSSLWFRPEGRGFICGLAPAADHDPDEPPLQPDYPRFERELWPRLAARVPAFEALRLTGAWSGYYEHCSFDRNGFVGNVHGVDNLYLACGFSGHGMQHAPAVGRSVAELISTGAYQTLDLSPLSHQRLAANAPIIEAHVA